MAIPTGPFPAEIPFADLRAGMHVQVVFEYFDSNESLTADLWVSKVDATGAYATTANLQIADPLTWDDSSRDETLYLLEEFTGDPSEPTINSVIQAADGTIYQRVEDATDPTNSVWYPVNSTTATTWTDITAAGLATIILNGGQQ